MSSIPARREDQHQIRQLMRRGRYVYANYGNEDLAHFLEQGCSVLGGERAHPWGFLCLELEERPATLPDAAPSRAHIRSVVLARGRSPVVDVAQLMAASEERMRARLASATPHPVQISYFGTDPWLKEPLLHAGFHIAERVEFLYLNRLLQRSLPPIEMPPGIQLRAARTTDVDALARLDSEVFEPRWHFGQHQMLELLLSCRVQVAESQGTLVGYAALSVMSTLDPHEPSDAHLARLAVHPRMQGSGLGRVLLVDSLHHAQQEGIHGVLLNTQTTNQRAQRLYRSMGFRPTGQIVPLFIKTFDLA